MTLLDVKPGMAVQIIKMEDSKLKLRLMSMGLIRGTIVKVLRSAPLGDPIALAVRSYVLALRRADAEKIIVTLV